MCVFVWFSLGIVLDPFQVFAALMTRMCDCQGLWCCHLATRAENSYLAYYWHYMHIWYIRFNFDYSVMPLFTPAIVTQMDNACMPCLGVDGKWMGQIHACVDARSQMLLAFCCSSYFSHAHILTEYETTLTEDIAHAVTGKCYWTLVFYSETAFVLHVHWATLWLSEK